jgi:nucleoid-associated protein YgaU
MNILVNKHYKNYNYISRYTPFPCYYNTRDNKYVNGLTAYLDNTTVYTLYTVKQGDTFDHLALEFYNNPTFYWIICSFNHIRDPYMKLQEGQQLKIPSIANIIYDINGRS